LQQLNQLASSDLILDYFQNIYEAYQCQSHAILGAVQKIQEHLNKISEDNRQIFGDIPAYSQIWHCAQHMTYPEFYKAWHGQKSKVNIGAEVI
jgi:hypothetical protein